MTPTKPATPERSAAAEAGANGAVIDANGKAAAPVGTVAVDAATGGRRRNGGAAKARPAARTAPPFKIDEAIAAGVQAASLRKVTHHRAVRPVGERALTRYGRACTDNGEIVLHVRFRSRLHVAVSR